MIPIVYTLDVCPNCEKLKAALTEAGIEFEERDMQTRDSLVDLRCRACFTQEAPVLMTEDQVYESKQIFSQDGSVDSGILAALRP
ncbi:glutaredoxin family protein [Methanospirillum sp. J.3.6.1-F.2.7.3]|uniref:Glutaredoxin family protein n=1 Tax=Methanospirillum purgamenti TaxID=2834276 RepID=A0A8E7EKM9_9EURY|nr:MULTISPECIES: glutaredoxin domain-containing protein [Methanospirillum]MDX8551782.1 glutaredoxin domain-containing protein [Methanospirillum hungatei]QVV89700.1 glutaredoxin family protein [Methanospirillum sp. J.3.6.1-F.2.7.3]